MNNGQGLRGFNSSQIEFAALWWTGMLMGVDISEHKEMQPEIIRRQDAPDKIEVLNLFSAVSEMVRRERSLPSEKISVFTAALKEIISKSIRAGNLEQAQHGGKFLWLRESSGDVSPELIEACEQAGFSSHHLYTYGHNESLILHDDGQIYHQGLGYNASRGHMLYEGCPKSEYEVVNPHDLRFSDAKYIAEYGRVLVLTLHHGASYDECIAKITEKWPKDSYLFLWEKNVPDFDALRPEDLLNPEKVDPSLVWQENRYYPDYKTNQRIDRVKDTMEAPRQFPGASLEPTGTEGVYLNISAPFRKYIAPKEIQFGSGYNNIKIAKGQLLVRFDKQQIRGNSPEKPISLYTARDLNISLFKDGYAPASRLVSANYQDPLTLFQLKP